MLLREALGVPLLVALVPEELDHLGAVVRVAKLHHGLGDAAVAEDLRAQHHVGHDRVGGDVGLELLVR